MFSGKRGRHWFQCGLLLISSIPLPGCQGGRQETDRLEKGREALQSQLSSLQGANDGSSFHQYLIEHLEEGLRKLDSLPDRKLAKPVLIFATLAAPSTTDTGKQWRLGFDWLEDGFSVTGFYLVDKDGKVTDFPATLPRDYAERSSLKNTAWRETWFPAIADASDKSWENETVRGQPVGKPIVLPIRAVSGNEIQLGLLTDAGRESSTVTVAIQGPKESSDAAPP